MTENLASTERLWRKYAFYNREMLKFVQMDDIDMFLTLNDKLLGIYEELRTVPADGFLKTPPGKALLTELTNNTRVIQITMQRWLNGEKQKQSVTRAYGTLGVPNPGAFKGWDG